MTNHTLSPAPLSTLPSLSTYPHNPPPLNDIIPIDIWRTIFQLIHDQDLSSSLSINTKLHYTPTTSEFMPRQALILSHVCTHWRAIALSQPLLWTHPFICFQTNGPLELLTLMLQRATPNTCIDANTPTLTSPTNLGSDNTAIKLDITLVAYSSDLSDENIPHLRRVLLLLKSIAHRWKSLSLTIGKKAKREIEAVFLDVPKSSPSPSSLVEATPHTSPRCSSLQTLHVALAKGREGMGKDAYGLISRLCHALDTSPNTIAIGGWCRGHEGLPNLTYIKIHKRLQVVKRLCLWRRDLRDLRELLETMRLMGALEELEIVDCWCECGNAIGDTDSRITLQILRKLKVENMTELFSSILTPSLTHISVTPPLDTPSLRTMLDQSQCLIKHLHVEANGQFYQYLYYFLSSPAFMSLESLTLEADEITEDEIRFLGMAKGVYEIPRLGTVEAPVFKDSLRRMTLLGCCVGAEGELGRMVRARMTEGCVEVVYVEVAKSGRGKREGTGEGECDDDTQAYKREYEVFRRLKREGYDAELRWKAVVANEQVYPPVEHGLPTNIVSEM